VPEVSNLDEYCGWLAEVSDRSLETRRSKGILWNLLDFYHSRLARVRMSFDPPQIFRACVAGGEDARKLKVQPWCSFYESVLDGSGMWGVEPLEEGYHDRLLTTSAAFDNARQIEAGGFLDPGYCTHSLCFSSGQVVTGRSFEVTYIFDKKQLEKIYDLWPLSENDREREIRIGEPVSVEWALGCIPTCQEVLAPWPGHWAQIKGTKAVGQETLQRWEENYLETGQLWDKAEKEKIIAAAQKLDKDVSQFRKRLRGKI